MVGAWRGRGRLFCDATRAVRRLYGRPAAADRARLRAHRLLSGRVSPIGSFAGRLPRCSSSCSRRVSSRFRSSGTGSGWSSAAFYRSVMMIERGARVLVVHGDRSPDERHQRFRTRPCGFACHDRAFGPREHHVHGERKASSAGPRRIPADTLRPKTARRRRFRIFCKAAHQDVPYFFTRWPLHFDYVYILFTKHGAQIRIPSDMKQIFDGPSFQLYRVTKPG